MCFLLWFLVRNEVNEEGLTPLSLAVICRKNTIVLELLAGGADVNFMNNDGMVHIAKIRGNKYS